MSMKVVKLYLYCDTAQAMTLIECIDQLRDAVVEQYAEEIQQNDDRGGSGTIRSNPVTV